MKRLLVSVLLLLGIGGICFLTITVQREDTETLLALVDRMQESYRQEDKEVCKELSEQFSSDICQKMPYWSLFLPHHELLEIQELAVMLPVILEQKEDSHFASELEQCRLLLTRSMEGEYPLLQNIL